MKFFRDLKTDYLESRFSAYESFAEWFLKRKLGFWGVGKNSTGQKEFVNKSLFLVVELKQSIPRLFHSHPRIAPTVRVVTVGGWK
ncbi:TPA: hypothetical protein U0927_001383 [Streptococcus suis 2524]|uniref:hypothetical protein n=2 Tax=Streptococcus suis TaxID=1307 RepID=UPI0004172576|nr:hypothetical protein [Streptococcus suis]HEM3217939.1 hypothetical protein [Streptococcus suis 2524]MCK3906936.1 hypothetical protein [Streptococcus suis]MDY7284035.1 hypothetical protein [Streptococcus suis]NQJ86435.1 hypothetical protein [Streptococcus suis]NQK20614.1 hypothetical protein [Streptococcus suis]